VETSGYRATHREYVAAIYELAEEGLPVIQARVADWLGVSRASVSEMVRRMVDDGLVTLGDELLSPRRAGISPRSWSGATASPSASSPRCSVSPG
jgi:DtxR family transcriptional regulator, Mn-dependent transcriptional regulator